MRHAAVVIATFWTWTVVAADVRAQAHAAPTPSPSETVSRSEVQPSASASTPRAADRAPAVNARPAAPRQASMAEVEQVVMRLRKRIAEELSAQPAGEPHRPAKTATVQPRVRLVWRLALVWPQELLDPSGTPSPASTRQPHTALSGPVVSEGTAVRGSGGG